MSQHRMEIELKVGIFVSVGLGLIMLAILLLGSTENIMAKKSTYSFHTGNVEGLISGAKVMLGGIQIGTVDKVVFDDKTNDIRVDLNITQETAKHIKKDSTVEITTQGVLGDKFVSIAPGDVQSEPLPAGSVIPIRPTQGFATILSKSDQLMARLTSTVSTLDRVLKEFESGGRSERFFTGMAATAKNLASASEKLDREMEDLRLKKIVRNLEAITDKVNGGTGTVGALINDPSLYDNMKALVGEVNRNRIVRNLVRQTIKDAEEKQAEKK